MRQDRGVTSSISPCEGDGPGANPGFLTNFKMKMRGERSKRLAYPQADSAQEQSQPRFKDLNTGIWIRAVRRAMES